MNVASRCSYYLYVARLTSVDLPHIIYRLRLQTASHHHESPILQALQPLVRLALIPLSWIPLLLITAKHHDSPQFPSSPFRPRHRIFTTAASRQLFFDTDSPSAFYRFPDVAWLYGACVDLRRLTGPKLGPISQRFAIGSVAAGQPDSTPHVFTTYLRPGIFTTGQDSLQRLYNHLQPDIYVKGSVGFIA